MSLADTKLNPYEILSPAGAGGKGQVYRARNVKSDHNAGLRGARFETYFEPSFSLASF